MPLTSLLPVPVHTWGNTRARERGQDARAPRREEWGGDVLFGARHARMPALPGGRNGAATFSPVRGAPGCPRSLEECEHLLCFPNPRPWTIYGTIMCDIACDHGSTDQTTHVGCWTRSRTHG